MDISAKKKESKVATKRSLGLTKYRRRPRKERGKMLRGQRRTITERMRTISLWKMAAALFPHGMDVDPVKAEINVPNKFR